MNRSTATILLALGAALGGIAMSAQAIPTASRELDLSAFGGLTGVYTGLGGKNLSISAGADLGFRSFYGLNPAIEVRGLYPINNGHISSQRNVLAGIRLGRVYGRVTPYADLLYGLGQTHYNPLYVNPAGTFAYSFTSSTVLSPGIGADLRISRPLSIKVDAQFQRYATPVTTAGHPYAKPITVGVVYHLFTDKSPRSR